MRTALRRLLWALGAAMAAASRVSPRFRSQVTRDLVVELATRDGVAHHFVFRARERSMSSHRGPATAPDLRLRLGSSAQALRVLLSPRAAGRIVGALQRGTATLEGRAAALLWFHGLTRIVAPIGRAAGHRRSLPGAVRGPQAGSAVAARTPREPEAQALDPAWKQAWAQRAKLHMVQVAGGAPLEP